MDFDIGPFLSNEVGVDQKGLVPDELVALQTLEGVLLLHVVFELAVVLRVKGYLPRDAVPDLWRPEVLEVDRRHVVVLHVPGEDGPEAAEVQVGHVDSAEADAAHPVRQAAAQVAQVPGPRLVPVFEQRALDVRAVERGALVQAGPEELLVLLYRLGLEALPARLGPLRVLGDVHRFLLN